MSTATPPRSISPAESFPPTTGPNSSLESRELVQSILVQEHWQLSKQLESRDVVHRAVIFACLGFLIFWPQITLIQVLTTVAIVVLVQALQLRQHTVLRDSIQSLEEMIGRRVGGELEDMLIKWRYYQSESQSNLYFGRVARLESALWFFASIAIAATRFWL